MEYKIIKVPFHPPEADFLANELRSCANQVDAYKQELARMVKELDATWSGGQKEIWMSGEEQFPPRLDYIIEMFRNYADFYANLQITREEKVPVD